ncbi:CU044_5270 family protein [Actinocorallia longicatena]|uniref:CU044_5270 family protein n=1 Tax=Actinocorallia longicatena TaxID=111803 RepID=A0ABP6QNL5_9ACTN
MDELHALKDLLARPAAAQAVKDEGRHRLRNTMLRGPAPKRRRTRLFAGGLTVTAAGLATVVALVGGGSPAEREAAPNGPPLPAPVLMSGSEVLTNAATAVGRQPSEGAYWRISSTGVVARSATGRGYDVVQKMKQTFWLSTSPGGKSWTVSQYLGFVPATEADAAKWRADGSPESWRLEHKDPRCPKGRCAVQILSTKPQPVVTRAFGGKGVVGELAGLPITIAQVRALPTDPAKLKAAIARRLPGAKGRFLDMLAFENGMQLIMNLPVSSGVRAATYRMMAALPGVRSLGEATDQLGRKGHAVTMGADGSKKVLHRVIIDPSTGLPLATEMFTPADGTVLNDTTVTAAGWTDDRPDLSRP